MNPSVNWFFDKTGPWQEAYSRLRELVLSTGMQEELKWGCPCYLHKGKNVVLIHGFKQYCALLFMKGALLPDAANKLVQQTANVQAARQLRFSSVPEIEAQRSLILDYLDAAMAAEESGAEVMLKPTTSYEMAAEFQVALAEMPELKTAFDKLTPGRQRGYWLHFGQAKLAKTRNERVEKCISRILAGKGLED